MSSRTIEPPTITLTMGTPYHSDVTGASVTNNSEHERNNIMSWNNLQSRFQVNKVGMDVPTENVYDYNDGLSPNTENNNPYVYDTLNINMLSSQLTREVLPDLANYKNTLSVHQVNRPTLDELHNETFNEKSSNKNEEVVGPVRKGKIIKLGWLEGVLMTCLLNIWGVMLFLRLSWVVGQAGIINGFLLISLANLVTFITAFSMSAVSTNGLIKGGGIYYMISRSLGPEFGAAIGLMFTIANAIAVSMYIVGFCESLNSLLKSNGWGVIIDGGSNDIRVIGTGVLIILLIIAFVGMDWVTRTQIFLLIVLIGAQVDFIVGSFMGPTDKLEEAKGFVGYSRQTFMTNLWEDYRQGFGGVGTKQDFFSVFGVFFPAVTGIGAGANLSGDLKNPATAIPKGTIIAVIITYITYFGYAIMMGGCTLRETSGDLDEFLATTAYTDQGLPVPSNVTNYMDCQDRKCEYGLLNDPQVMELVSAWGPLVYGGCFAATLSSAVASLVGAPRVFQALCKDKLYPGVHFFAKGYGVNNDPFRGYILIFFISLGCLLIAELNAIASLLSNFFLAAYCFINFSVFHATITKSPGWRPSFKYYNAWVSLGGSILCIVVMFLMSWSTALLTVGISVFLYLCVLYRKPNVNWGSSAQAQSYNSALKSVQDLIHVEEHVKNYRPQLLVLSGMPSSRPPLIDFATLLIKNLSLMICGHVAKGPYNQRLRNVLQKQAYDWLSVHKKKGFYTLVEEEHFERGCHNIMRIAGLGRLRPNMILMGYKSDWVTCNGNRMELKGYFDVIHDALDMYLSVGILRVPEGLDYTNIIEEEDGITAHQLLDLKKEKTRTQSDGQLSTDGSNESSSTPSTSQLEQKVGIVNHISDASTGKKSKKKSISGMYTGPGGVPLPRDVISNLTQFKRKQKKSTIDVWWLYDDGGLTMLLPYILSTRSQFQGCTLRIFTINKMDELGAESRNMAALLGKFRIDYSDVIGIPNSDITKKAEDSTTEEFETLISRFKAEDSNDGCAITDSELSLLNEKTNRHLRLHELLQVYSRDSTFVVMTLPIPRKGTVSAPLYMAWLEIMSKGMPPFLFVRGNQTSVLTFYS